MAEARVRGGGGRRAIEKQIVLPFSKAVEISMKSIKIRLGRSLITVGGVILAIAFLMSIWTSNAIERSLREANLDEINLVLQRKGVDLEDIGATTSKQHWLIVLSLIVCITGITNAMLMSVTERFREIGTMKTLGALDGFIVKLFLLESSFQGSIGTTIGVLLGAILTVLIMILSYGEAVFTYFPTLDIVKSAVLAILIGSVLSVGGAVYPAYRASKMQAVDALRTEV